MKRSPSLATGLLGLLALGLLGAACSAADDPVLETDVATGEATSQATVSTPAETPSELGVYEQALVALGWDEEWVDLVVFVEEAREMAFERPVAIEFISDEEFVSSDDLAEFIGDHTYEPELTAILRALNLVDADYSLAQNVNVGLEVGVIGLYRGSGERIIVRGAEKNVL
jgi:hypothetical protein